MFRTKSFSSFLLFLTFIVLSCQDGTVKKTRVTIKNTSDPIAELVVSRYHYFNLEQIVLGKSNFRADSTATVELELTEPAFVYYQAGPQYGGLLLEPGDDLVMVLPDKRFSGKGREANEFMTQSRKITSRYEVRKGLFYGSFSPMDFKQRMDSLAAELKEFKDGYFDTVTVSSKVEKLLIALHDLMLLNYYQYYAMVNDVDKIRSEAFRPVREKAQTMPINDKIKNSFMIEYATALQLYSDLQITRPLSKLVSGETRMHHPDAVLKIVADTLLMSRRYSSNAKEFFLAKTIDTGIGGSGITPLMDSLFQVYKQKFSSSPYIELIQKRYTKWMAMTSGKPAPDFYGLTMDGDTTSLSDLRGKVVYIDVWATWCVPCIAEFPSSIALRRKFKEDENLTFLYVSIDSNKEAWKKFVTNNPNLKGIHLIDQNSSLSEPYMLAGVPRYILIDARGNIVSADAPRPSSGEIEGLIQQLMEGD